MIIWTIITILIIVSFWICFYSKMGTETVEQFYQNPVDFQNYKKWLIENPSSGSVAGKEWYI